MTAETEDKTMKWPEALTYLAAFVCLGAIALGIGWFIYDAHMQTLKLCTELARQSKEAALWVAQCRSN